MFIKEFLFYKYNFLRGQRSLSSILEDHKRALIGRIRDVASLDAMTDQFLAQVIEDAVVEPVVFHIDRKTKKTRQEDKHLGERNPRVIFRPKGAR